MRKYTETQILSILKQSEQGFAIESLCREHGMSRASFYKWRSKYGGIDISIFIIDKECINLWIILLQECSICRKFLIKI